MLIREIIKITVQINCRFSENLDIAVYNSLFSISKLA